MICPYCKKEMELGNINSEHELVWNKDFEQHLLKKHREGSIKIARESAWFGATCLAYLCRDCGKIIIDINDEDCDLNKK